jgi:uncharacterized protein YaaQ
MGATGTAPMNADICIGGATVFILDVENFMHF